MRQFNLTPAMGKRLIAKAMAIHEEVRGACEHGTLAIIAGSTNGYVAQEVLASLGVGVRFERQGFHRGLTVAPGRKPAPDPFFGDVVIRNGEWVRGQTIYDVVEELREGDVVLKGANAFDQRGQPAVQIGHPQGGTILEAVRAVIGRRARLLVPVGLEKRVFGDVYELALRCNAPGGRGVRLFPFPGQVFTEIDAIRLLTGAEALQFAAGGICGAEGSVWLGVEGYDDQLDLCARLVRELEDEPLCIA